MSWKTTTAVFISLMLAALLVGCADVPSTGPAAPDLKAEYRFINADVALAGGAVTVDGAGAGSLASAGSATSHQSWDSGSRTVSFNGESIKVSMETDWRGSVVLLPQVTIGNETVRNFLKVNERRIFDSPVAPKIQLENDDGSITELDASMFRFINASDVSVDVNLWLNDSTSVDFASDVEPEGFANYGSIEMASYKVYVTDHTTADTLATFDTGAMSAKRYTAVVWGAAGAVAGKTLADD
ncbi:MAG: DUF4397 domain-containing protein [Calditrichaeota bacterium]|nr:MAG: DUF4397 domain-containing protein [Calditrichota bacterium]